MNLTYFQLKKKYQAILLFSLFLSFLRLITMPWALSFDYIFKGGSIFLLAILILLALRKKVRFLLFCAYLSATAGDVLLALQMPHSFLWGLSAFFVTHLFFITTFVYLRLNSNYTPSDKKWPLSILILFGVVFFLILKPNLGDFTPFVLAYMVALIAMVAFAILSQLSFFVGFGAILFLISDSLLAFQKFISLFPGDDALIWLTYYFGQLFIAYGFLSSKKTFLQ